MIAGIVKKLILTSFLFIDFIHPSKSVDLHNTNNGSSILSLSKTSNKKNLSNYSNSSFDSFWENSIDKNLLDKFVEPLIADNTEKQREILIKSDQQSEINGVVYATILTRALSSWLRLGNFNFNIDG